MSFLFLLRIFFTVIALESNVCWKYSIFRKFYSSRNCSNRLIVQERPDSEADDGYRNLFSNAMEEVNTPKILNVIGEFPEYLMGTLVRNGPALFDTYDISESKKRKFTHIFDGLAKLTAFTFKNGNIEFRTRFLRSKLFTELVTNRKDIPPFVCLGPVEPTFTSLDILTSGLDIDNFNVNVLKLERDDSCYALTDGPKLMKFNSSSLETLGKLTYANGITQFGGIESFSSAHPKKCGNYTYNYFLEHRPLTIPGLPDSSLLHIARFDSKLKREIIGSVEIGKNVLPYIHDFSLSKNYAVVFVYPLRADASMKGVFNGKGFMPQLEWNSKINTKIYVFDINRSNQLKRESEKLKPIAEFEAPPIFAYHHINCYEDFNSNIIVDITGYDNGDIVVGKYAFLYLENVLNSETRKYQERDGLCYRYVLPISNRNTNFGSPSFVHPRILHMEDEHNFRFTGEFATVEESRFGKQYRYSYAVCHSAGNDSFRGGYMEWALLKRDHDAAERIYHFKNNPTNITSEVSVKVWKERGMFPGEPIFVRNPLGKEEDDGIVLSHVYDSNRRENFLLGLDGKSFKEVARAYTGTVTPMGFHGQYFT
jgi:beta,beta-carotene 9',10'-dioxygenase